MEGRRRRPSTSAARRGPRRGSSPTLTCERGGSTHPGLEPGLRRHMTALLQHLLSGWSRLLVEQASKGFAEQRRQDLQARWQRTRSVVRRDGCNRLAVAHLGRRPSRPVDRAKVLGGAAVDCSSRRRARRRCPVDARRGARVRAARHRCRCVRARPPKPQRHQRHSPNGASSARRHGAGWDLGRRDENTPACPNGQAKYYSSKLIQPGPSGTANI